MALTSPDNIYSPNIDDNWAVPQAMGALADSVQEALNNRANAYIGTSQERRNFAPDSPGTRWQDTDGTKREYQWDGSSWVRTGAQKILWQGTPIYLQAGQSVTLSEPISAQESGILLVWQKYAGSNVASESDYNYIFIPKIHVQYASGRGVTSVISQASGDIARKYAYITDTTVTGYSANSSSPNNKFVLTRVLGV